MARFLICLVTVLVGLLLLCATSLAAQSGAAALVGTVTDQDGARVAGAEVTALSIASGRTLTATTDASGKYELTGLQLGSYRLSARGEGFATASRSVTLRSSSSSSERPVIEDFLLMPGIVESSVTVTAGKGSARVTAELPQTISITDKLQIEERRPQSTLRAVERAPNLTPIIANPALERPRLRGLASNRLLIILDGERLNNVRSDPTTGVSPSVIDVTQLEAVEVLSGAGSSLYGSDALGGIINLITTSPVRVAGTQYLGIRFDGDLHTNGLFRRGAATINWSSPSAALRLSGSLFRSGNYHSGNRAISLEEVVRLGSFAAEMGNKSGNSVARTYAVWSLPAGAEIPNGQAHGFNDQLDLWLFPGDNQSLRYRQLNSQHKSLGFSFITPPYDQRTQFNGFRRLDKYGLRYEGREFTGWLPRLAASFYWQKYSFPDDTLTSPINPGSSWRFVPNPLDPQNPLAVLTGAPSTFTDTSFTDNKNSVTTSAFDLQATFAPFVGTLITTGIGYLRDSSADQFSRVEFAPGNLQAPLSVITGRASNPDAVYRNWGWFNLFEYEPASWLRLTGGLRLDNWKTEARATRGFPLGVESAILDASLEGLMASPGPINAGGTSGIVALINGTGTVATNRTVITGNAGVVLRLPGGLNPYFRWGNSYREPGITERYLLRDFGDPTFSVLVIPNTALKPERGQTYELGVHLQRSGWNASFGYFNNNLEDFIRSVFADPLFVPADPSRGLHPISPFFPFHGVLYVQRTNTARARIRGLEAAYEISVPLGRWGVMSPTGTLGWLKGSNLTPDEDTLNLIRLFYNRTDTPVPLHGSTEDAPLSGITPFRAINGVRYDSPKRRWFGEYEVRYQSRVRRVDPLDLTTTISTQYGSLASLNSFAVHTLRMGYTYVKENHRASFTFGVENLTDRLYFEHFQTAPAPGRAVVFGMTLELFNLLRK
ncbi:MAG TPA: TonB-dependent receptor [Pyrinomonadaceae bacterium]|jgi:outer membrane receptor protein involved in Fe transport